jgi:predicted solute-binding protein
MKRRLTLGHSPDPDDAFMFYGLAAGKLDTGGWEFEHVLQDIQTLNDRALRGELDITAISIHAYPYVADKYALTNCGSSMGDGYGPMVVTREPMPIEDLRGKIIAIPGERTTAFLALQLLLGRGETVRDQGTKASRDRGEAKRHPPAGSSDRASADSITKLPDHQIAKSAPQSTIDNRQSTIPLPPSLRRSVASSLSAPAFRYDVVMFDEILRYVEEGRADAGLIIHEGQLTYVNHRLHLVVDLGAWWKETTGLPLPLGGNAIRRDLGRENMVEIGGILRRSIEYSLAHREAAVAHAMRYARDMGRELADKFVGMYVNEWTIDYGDIGRRAVRELLQRGNMAGLVPAAGEIDFI